MGGCCSNDCVFFKRLLTQGVLIKRCLFAHTILFQNALSFMFLVREYKLCMCAFNLMCVLVSKGKRETVCIELERGKWERERFEREREREVGEGGLGEGGWGERG